MKVCKHGGGSTRQSWSWFSYCALMISVLQCSSCCHGQERPTLFLDKFNNSLNFQTSVCDRQQALWNNSLDLPDALRGLTLSVVVTNYTGRPNAPLFHLDSEGRIPPRNPGFFVIIMDEVAHRAGFEWRTNFGVANPLDEDEDGMDKEWTDVILWGIESFDISLEKWAFSVERASKKVSFPVGFWDSSIALVEYVPSGANIEGEVVWFAFLQPFSLSTWIAIFLAIFFTGIQFWFMERWNPVVTAEDAEEEAISPKTNLYLAGIAFTAGDFSFSPQSYADYVLGISFSFAALIIVSTYTANMASFLVTPRYIFFDYPNLNVAQEKNAKVCSYGKSVIDTILNKSYPNISPYTFSEDKMFSELRPGGSCDVAVHQYNAFRVYERNNEFNHDCAFATSGEVIVNIPAGMVTKLDSKGKCTSLISYVLDYHLHAMIADGFVDSAFVNHLGQVGENQCRGDASTNLVKPLDDVEPPRLGIQDVGGIFLFHFAVCLYAVVVARAKYFMKKNKLRRNIMRKATRGAPTAPKWNFELSEEKFASKEGIDDEPEIALSFVGSEKNVDDHQSLSESYQSPSDTCSSDILEL